VCISYTYSQLSWPRAAVNESLSHIATLSRLLSTDDVSAHKSFVSNSKHTKDAGGFDLDATGSIIATGLGVENQHICIDPTGIIYVGGQNNPLTLKISGMIDISISNAHEY
jgi:hypothetical protein